MATKNLTRLPHFPCPHVYPLPPSPSPRATAKEVEEVEVSETVEEDEEGGLGRRKWTNPGTGGVGSRGVHPLRRFRLF